MTELSKGAPAPTSPSELAKLAQTMQQKPRIRAGAPAPAPQPSPAPKPPAKEPVPHGQLSLVPPGPATPPTNLPTVAADEVEDDIPQSADPVLVNILSWKRPFKSAAEIHFMEWLHSEIKSRVKAAGVPATFEVMVEGNVAVVIKRPDGKPSATLFSCHTDTVHSECNGRQKLLYDPNFGHLILDKNDPQAGSCLGADDGAGVWLMLEMISAKVPGTYVFHRGEEQHGVGSHRLLAEKRDWLEEFEIAVAFDRKGLADIVTHQGGQECASDKFGLALAARLNAHGFKYTLSRTGTFTDTKVYRNVICECVNISVGYYDQHSKDESLDFAHLSKLRDAVCKIDWDALPVERDPKAAPAPSPTHQSIYPRTPATRVPPRDDSFAGFPSDDDDLFDKRTGTVQPSNWQKRINRLYGAMDAQPQILEELADMTMDDLATVIDSEPGMALDLIVELVAELRGAYAKITGLRTLLGTATSDR